MHYIRTNKTRNQTSPNFMKIHLSPLQSVMTVEETKTTLPAKFNFLIFSEFLLKCVEATLSSKNMKTTVSDVIDYQAFSKHKRKQMKEQQFLPPDQQQQEQQVLPPEEQQQQPRQEKYYASFPLFMMDWLMKTDFSLVESKQDIPPIGQFLLSEQSRISVNKKTIMNEWFHAPVTISELHLFGETQFLLVKYENTSSLFVRFRDCVIGEGQRESSGCFSTSKSSTNQAGKEDSKNRIKFLQQLKSLFQVMSLGHLDGYLSPCTVLKIVI